MTASIQNRADCFEQPQFVERGLVPCLNHPKRGSEHDSESFVPQLCHRPSLTTFKIQWNGRVSSRTCLFELLKLNVSPGVPSLSLLAFSFSESQCLVFAVTSLAPSCAHQFEWHYKVLSPTYPAYGRAARSLHLPLSSLLTGSYSIRVALQS